MLLDSHPPRAERARRQLQARMTLRRPSGALGLEWPQLRRLYGEKVATDKLLSFAAAAFGAVEEDAES